MYKRSSLDEKKGVLELDTDAVVIVPQSFKKHAEVDGSLVCKTRYNLPQQFLNPSGGGVGAFQLLVLFASLPPLPNSRNFEVGHR